MAMIERRQFLRMKTIIEPFDNRHSIARLSLGEGAGSREKDPGTILGDI